MDKIHPEAIKNINNKAEELLGFLSSHPPFQSYEDKILSQKNVTPEIHISAVITPKDIIGTPTFNFGDTKGNETGKTFILDSQTYHLYGEGYKKLLKASELVYKYDAFSKFLSFNFIKNTLFLWVEKRYKNECNPLSFFEFLCFSGAKSTKSYRVMIPIPFTTTEGSFTLGKIYFETLKKDKISEWFDFTINNAKSDTERKPREDLKKEIQGNYQGYLIGIFDCIAEKENAVEKAYFHLDNSLSILRLLSVSNFTPDFISTTHQYGKLLKKKEYFLVERDTTFFQFSNGFYDKNVDYFNISKHTLDILTELNSINQLLKNEQMNNYNEKLLESILIYSKHTLRYEISDKVLYILVALECMLLRNNHEQIQQSIGDRIAFLIGENAENRLEIAATIKEVYNIRSRFVHHGKSSISDVELIEKFMNYAWLTFIKLIGKISTFETKDELVIFLDRLKYS